MTEITCPECGGAQHYSLKDKRLQCALCRKKFTAGKQTGRLPASTLKVIAQSFWQMVPASAAAVELGLNSKTLQRYYDVIRRGITEANEAFAKDHFGGTGINPAIFHAAAACRGLGAGTQPLFCLVDWKGKFSLLFPGEDLEAVRAVGAIPAILGWAYAQDDRALSLLDLDRTHFLFTAETNDGALDRSFWPDFKRGLLRYHGGFRKNFRLFVREMEFRCNYRNEASAVGLLMEILQKEEFYKRR